jgi:hypothetical protein
MLFLTGPQPRSSTVNTTWTTTTKVVLSHLQPSHMLVFPKVILSMVKPNLVTPKFVSDAGDLDVPEITLNLPRTGFGSQLPINFYGSEIQSLPHGINQQNQQNVSLAQLTVTQPIFVWFDRIVDKSKYYNSIKL